MLKNYRILTVTHQTTNTENIAEFIIPTDDKATLQARLHELRETYGLQELMYLATCNRVLFFYVNHRASDADFICDFFRTINPNFNAIPPENILQKVNALEGEAAIQHLFEIAASVDSMVVGEREIFRQLREAYEFCHASKLTGDNIRVAMRNTVEVAKEVYATTRIGEKSVSVVSLAFRKLQELSLPTDSKFLLVGAGKTNALFAKFMLKHGYTNATIYNRSIEKSEALATQLGGTARAWADLGKQQMPFDVMVVCTAAIEPVIEVENYAKILGNGDRKKTIIDLSLPHNVSPEVVNQYAVNYIDLEELRQLAKENMAFRVSEVANAKKLIAKRVNEFKLQFRQRQIERAMSDIPSQMKGIKAHAMTSVFKNELHKLNPEALDLVERMMGYMEKRCISIPMVAIKDAYKKLHQQHAPIEELGNKKPK